MQPESWGVLRVICREALVSDSNIYLVIEYQMCLLIVRSCQNMLGTAYDFIMSFLCLVTAKLQFDCSLCFKKEPSRLRKG